MESTGTRLEWRSAVLQLLTGSIQALVVEGIVRQGTDRRARAGIEEAVVLELNFQT